MLTNKMPLAIYLDFPKFTFNFTLRRKHLLNLSSAILRSDWEMSRLWFVSLQNSEKSVGIVEIGPCGTEINQSGCCDWQVGKKSGKRRQKGSEKRLRKGSEKGCERVTVAMIIKLATDESCLASKL